MSACPSFGSTSEVALYYVVEPSGNPANLAAETLTLHQVPITGESVDAALTSAVSEQITPQRSYAGSKLVQGEVTGSFNYEMQAGGFFYDMMIAVLQANETMMADGAGGAVQAVATAGTGISPVGQVRIRLIGKDVGGNDWTLRLIGGTGNTGLDTVAADFGAKTITITRDTAVGGATRDLTAAKVASLINDNLNDHATATVLAAGNILVGTAGSPIVVNFSGGANATAGVSSWADGETIKNGSTKHCLAFVKRVQVGNNLYDWYIFRGCQIGSLSAEIQPNSLINGAINVMGVKPQAVIKASAAPGTWTLTNAPTIDLMSGVDSLQGFAISSGGTPTGVTMQNVSFTIENQLRQQAAVGLGHPFSAGIASGRLSAKFSGSAYYQNPAIFEAFLEDDTLEIAGSLLDSGGSGISFECGTVKVTAGAVPMASAPDQDLLISSEFQAFEDAVTGTISVTKVTA
jgi:hypothetical protein